METISRNLLTFMLNALWQVPLAPRCRAGRLDDAPRPGMAPARPVGGGAICRILAALGRHPRGGRLHGRSTSVARRRRTRRCDAGSRPNCRSRASRRQGSRPDNSFAPSTGDSCCWPTCRSSPGAWRGSPSPPLEPSACAPPLPGRSAAGLGAVQWSFDLKSVKLLASARVAGPVTAAPSARL